MAGVMLRVWNAGRRRFGVVRHTVLLCAVGALVVTLGPLSRVASASPPEPVFAEHIDQYADYDGQETCDPELKPGVVAFALMVLEEYPDTDGSLDPRSCGSGTSEHYDGRAWDWMVDAEDPEGLADAEDLLDWLLDDDVYRNDDAPARRIGIMYIIWNHRMWRAYRPDDGWEPYDGPNPHTDHVHFSFAWDGALEESTWTTGRDLGRRLDQARLAATWRNRDRLDLFRRGRSQNVEQAIWPDRDLSWFDLGGSVRSGPAAVWSSERRLWIFAQGTSGNLVSRRWESATGWEPWQEWDVPITAAPGVTTRDGRVDLAIRAADGTAAHARWTRKRGWAKWTDLGGTLYGAPSISWRGARELIVFNRDGTGHLEARIKRNGEWAWWEDLGGVLTSGPATASVRRKEVTVVARDVGGGLGHRSRAKGTEWSSWASLGGYGVSGAAASARSGRLDLFVRSPDGGVLANTYRPKSGWSGWEEQ